MRTTTLFTTIAAAGFGLLLPALGGETKRVFTDEDRAWWAIQPVRDPVVPGDASAGHPVDAFVKRKLKEAKLTAAAAAGPDEYLRRACFDLHGLPPTPAQCEAFRAAWAEDQDAAVAALVDELLASPRYGERWAQHWLDVVRYAESDGYREDAFRPETFPYRDYVIRAFNADKPYHEFVREQLAADEFAADDPAIVVATGFLRLGIYEWNQRNAEMQHELIINEITSLTGEAFLGIGIGCAQCHDHKFDPLLQRDYYALQAFLSSTSWPSDRKLGTVGELAAYEQWEKETAAIRAEMEDLLAAARDKIIKDRVVTFPANVQEMWHKPESERSTYEQQIVLLVNRQADREARNVNPEKTLAKTPEKLARYKELTTELKSFEARKPKLLTAFIATDTAREPAVTHMGSGPDKAIVEPAYLALLNAPAPKITPREHTTGRRSALADWIVHPGNPFTARVFVNRLWQHHFGTGLVATPNDFGTLGEPPSHPELLDWLTSRFTEGGWKAKPLHRLIMTSAAYRQTARLEPGQLERRTDPFNRLLWRFPPTRLSAEQVRDAMLAVSGELKHRDQGGPSASGDSPVRSIYVKKLRNTPDEILHSFDAPAGFDSAPERPGTTTPTQALLLSNNEWPLARARAFAKRLFGDGKNTGPEDIARAFRSAWGRDASDPEVTLAIEFLAAQTAEHKTKRPPAPVAKFPNETGLRPITQNFGSVSGIALGNRALWLQPTSRFEQLHLSDPNLASDRFTIEAIVQLDAIHKDGKVNTLVSRWNGNQGKPGWAFGVTSAKSRYQPRNLIVQLIGTNPGGDIEYEVVASNLRVPTGRPVYLAAAIEPRPNGEGTVTFHLVELGDPKAELQTATIPHNIAGNLQDPGTRLLVGGRDEPLSAHLWDGQVGRFSLSIGALKTDRLFVNSKEARGDVIEASFRGENGAEPIPGSSWLKKAPPRPTANPQFEALVDFCHALLSSNEFLYLH